MYKDYEKSVKILLMREKWNAEKLNLATNIEKIENGE